MKCVECRIGSRNNFPSDVSAQAHCGPLSILTLLLPARLPPWCLALSLLPSLLRWKKGEEAPCPKAEFVLMLSKERENAARLVLVTWASSFRLYAHSNIKLEVCFMVETDAYDVRMSCLNYVQKKINKMINNHGVVFYSN